MRGEGGKLEDDAQASGLGITDGNTEPQRKSKALGSGRKRRRGRLGSERFKVAVDGTYRWKCQREAAIWYCR